MSNEKNIFYFKPAGSAKLDQLFLQQAWERAGLERKAPLTTLINHCHTTPFYQDLSKLFTNQYQNWKKAREETEYVAAAMISLLKNKNITPPFRKVISERIVEKIKEIIDPSDTPSSQKNDTVNVALNIRVPTHVNQRLDDIIADTKKAMHNCHLTELEYRNIGDDMEL